MYLGDTLVNLVSGLGTAKDKAEHGQFRHRYLTKYELDALYQNDWVAGTIIDAPADDMTREWRRWDAGPRQRNAIEQTELRLRVRHHVNHAMKMARLYGGAAILIGDGAADPAKELDLDRIKKKGVQFIHSLSRYELWAAYINRDPLSVYFGEPEYYTVSAPASAEHTGQQIHPSRVVRFLGQARLETTVTWDGWAISHLQRCYDAIRNVASTCQNLAAMTYEGKLDVISVPGLTQNILSEDYRSRLLSRFTMANMSKSVNNALLLDAEEKWEQKTIGFANFPEVLRTYLEIAAGASDIPLTRFLGTASKGLNNGGDADSRNYYDALRARQEVELRPAIERLDNVLIRDAIGANPPDITFNWSPLWQMRESERAAIQMQNAQRDQINAVMGALPPSVMAKAVQAGLIESCTYPGLEKMLEEAGNEAPAPLAPKAEQTANEINTPSARAVVARDADRRKRSLYAWRKATSKRRR